MGTDFGWLENMGGWFEFNGEFIRLNATNDSGWYVVLWGYNEKYKVKEAYTIFEITDEELIHKMKTSVEKSKEKK